MLDERVSDLIRLFYQGAHDDGAWTNALDKLRTLTDSRFIMVSAVDPTRKKYTKSEFYGADDSLFLNGIEDYKNHLFESDPMINFAANNPYAGFTSLIESIIYQNEDHYNHHYKNWHSSNLGSGNSVVCYSNKINQLTLGVSIHPSKSRGTHSSQDIKLFRMLFSHIENALNSSLRHDDINMESEATIIIDNQGKIIEMNEAAQRFLAYQDGIIIVDHRLVVKSSKENSRLQCIIASALSAFYCGGTGGILDINQDSCRRPIILRVEPLYSRNLFASFFPAAKVCIIDLNIPSLGQAADHWKAALSLTTAEARLASAVVGGNGSIPEIAQELGIAYSTARVQLASLFGKVGVHNQAQLVSCLSRLSQ